MRIIVFGIGLIVLFGMLGCLHRSPGVLHNSSIEPLNDQQAALREQLRRDVDQLATTVGPRNAAQSLSAISKAEQWIIDRLDKVGINSQRDIVDMNGGVQVANIEVTFKGQREPNQIVVLGGHYDTVSDSPGANDNASGVALLMAVAEHLKANPPERTVRVVFFVNEEAPFSFGIQMGSKVYAERCKNRKDNIVAMIAIDSVGCYSNAPGSQHFPSLIGSSLPSTANFIAFGSNLANSRLLDLVVSVFQSQSQFPSIGAASDSKMALRGDHAPFIWKGYPAILMSDTSEFRDKTYHRPNDTPDHLNYADMARMVGGFVKTVEKLGSLETVIP